MNKHVPAEAIAEHFGVSVITVRSWVQRDTIPPDLYLKVGRRYVFDLEGLEEHWANKTKAAYERRMARKKGHAKQAVEEVVDEAEEAVEETTVDSNVDFNLDEDF